MATLRANLDVRVDLLKQQDTGPRRFKLLAYTGADFARWYGKAVLDLAGLKVPDKLPILINHEDGLDHVAGFADKHSMSAEGLTLEGRFTETNPAAKRIAQLSDEGFPLTASVGVNVLKVEELSEKQVAQVNGRTVQGPLTIWRETALFETSFVTSNPADKATTAAALTHQERSMLTPEEFLKANPEAVQAWRDEGGKVALKSAFDRLSALLKAIADRPAFVLEQFLAGADVQAAKAALSDVLKTELEEAKKQKPPANPVLDSLKNKAGNPGLGFDGNAREQAVLNTEKLPPAERAKAELDAHPELAAQGVTVASLTAFYKAELRGQAKTDTVTRVAAAMSSGA